jgi:hypothetical protein
MCMKAPRTINRKPGRPATGQTPKRYFRMDDDGWTAIEKAAEAAGVTTSKWVRERLLSAVKRAKAS